MKECLQEDEDLEKFFIEVSFKGYVYIIRYMVVQLLKY